MSQTNLAREFEIKDLCQLQYFLGIKVVHSKEGIFLSQRKYILDLLDETGLLGGKGGKIPVDPNTKLQANKGGQRRFHRLVGRLIYLSHTRPDISFVVSQFMYDLNEEHMTAVRKIICYLKATPRKWILFTPETDLKLQGYIDADYGGSLVDRRSTTGYCAFLGGNLISWRSKKQHYKKQALTTKN